MRKLAPPFALLFVATVGAGAGCLGSAPSSGGNNPPGDHGGSDPGGLNDTGSSFDHDNSDDADPFKVLERIHDEGPPEVSSKMHSCQKLKYATVGRVLAQLGVNLGATGALSAAVLYKNGSQALGAPNYAARVPEAIELSTSGATKLFDIFVAAAPEIVAAMPTKCVLAGSGVKMFDGGGQCSRDGITCLTGAPATQAQVDLCNSAIAGATTPQVGQTIAVATILSAAHTCE